MEVDDVERRVLVRIDSGFVKPIAMAHVPVRYLLRKVWGIKENNWRLVPNMILISSLALMRNDLDQGPMPPRDEIDDSVFQMRLE